METGEIKNIIESILFALGRSVNVDEIVAALDVSKEKVEDAVDKLKEEYSSKKGITLVKVNNGYK